jgi:hypothetical protein
MPVKLPPGRARKFCIDRIAAEAEHDRLRGLRLQHADRHELLRHNHVRVGGERGPHRGHHVVEARGPEGAEFQVAAFDPAEFAQARAQRFKIRRRLARLPYAQPRNIANAIWLLLRTRHHRPRHGRASEQGDDIATPHHPNSRTSVSPGTAQPAHRPPF